MPTTEPISNCPITPGWFDQRGRYYSKAPDNALVRLRQMVDLQPVGGRRCVQYHARSCAKIPATTNFSAFQCAGRAANH